MIDNEKLKQAKKFLQDKAITKTMRKNSDKMPRSNYGLIPSKKIAKSMLV